MQQTSPKNLAFLSSILFTVIQQIILIAIYYFSNIPIDWILIGIDSVIFFAIVYFLQRQILFGYLYEKVKLIYKKIQDEFVEDMSHINSSNTVDNVLYAVDKDVTKWLESKKDEIVQLKQMAQYRKEFLGNVSHELKTPIFSIQGYISTLLDGAIDDPEVKKKYLKKADKNIDRMISIVEDLEQISKLEHGQLNLEIAPFDMIILIQEIIEGLEDKAQKKHITLKITEISPKSVIVLSDRKYMAQVVNNLILNAINYGSEGGYVMVQLYDMDENYLIEIIDNGIGIAKEHLSRLFERFYRVDKHRSTEYGGTGLGLAIVKHIIEAQNQTINVRSTLGVGTTFAFTLKKA